MHKEVTKGRMGSYLLWMFGISLALTIIVELIVAFLVRLFIGHIGKGRRKAGTVSVNPQQDSVVLGTRGHMALLVVLVNVLTNPLAVLLCWLGRMYLPQHLSLPLQLAVEAAVVAAEAWVYRSFMEKSGWQTGRPVLLAIATNICSYVTGIVCAGWIDFALWVLLLIRRA